MQKPWRLFYANRVISDETDKFPNFMYTTFQRQGLHFDSEHEIILGIDNTTK